MSMHTFIYFSKTDVTQENHDTRLAVSQDFHVPCLLLTLLSSLETDSTTLTLPPCRYFVQQHESGAKCPGTIGEKRVYFVCLYSKNERDWTYKTYRV